MGLAPAPVIAEARQVNPWAVALTVTLATFMELLDTSIANVSLPHIAGGLGRSFDETTWVLTSYLVANAVVLPMSAWLSRVFGRKRYYMISVALFTATSFLCGIAPSLNFLVIFRVLQGIGGGGLAPVEQAILVDTFPATKRAAAFALYSVAIVTAPAIGPPLGGWITDSFSWRWVFFINVPIGLISLFFTSRLVSDPPAFKAEVAEAKRLGKLKIDYIGISLIALGFAFLEVVLDRGQIDDWLGSRFITSMLIAAVACLAFAIWWELRAPDPVVELGLLRERNFAISNIFYFLFGFVLFGSTTMIPEILQSLYGYTATDAGLVLGTGRRGHYRSCAYGRGVDAKGSGEAALADRFQLCCGLGLDVLLRVVQSADGLSPLRAGSRFAGLWVCVPFCAGERAGLFVSAAGEEQQGLEPDQPRAQLGWQLRGCVHHHHARAAQWMYTAIASPGRRTLRLRSFIRVSTRLPRPLNIWVFLMPTPRNMRKACSTTSSTTRRVCLGLWTAFTHGDYCADRDSAGAYDEKFQAGWRGFRWTLISVSDEIFERDLELLLLLPLQTLFGELHQDVCFEVDGLAGF